MAGIRLPKWLSEWVRAHSVQATIYFALFLAAFYGVYGWIRHPKAPLWAIAAPDLVLALGCSAVMVLLVRHYYSPEVSRLGSKEEQRERERRAGW